MGIAVPQIFMTGIQLSFNRSATQIIENAFLLVNRIKSPLTWEFASVMAPSNKIYLKNASHAQGLCCKPIQNARKLQVEPVTR
jgi:hypothetical protein